MYECIYVLLQVDLLIRFTGPHKLLSTAKTLVPQCHGCVNDVLSITTYRYKPKSFLIQKPILNLLPYNSTSTYIIFIHTALK